CVDAVLNSVSADMTAEIVIVAPRSVVPVTPLNAPGERVRLVTTDAPFHFPAACNDGAAEARGAVLVFVPIDTVPQERWLHALLAMAEAHPQAAVIGSQIVALDQTVESAGFLIGQELAPVLRYRGFPVGHPAVERSCRLTAAPAAGLLVRRDAFQRVAGF